MNKTIIPQALYEVPHASEILGLSKSRTYALIREGKIKAKEGLINGRLLIRGRDLQEYKNACRKLDEF